MPDTVEQWQATQTRQLAADNAMQAYQQGMLELGNQQLAFQKAQQVWKETLDKAGLTGQYEGMPTQAALQYGAENFGTWGAPQAGQQTLASQQQTWNQGYQNAGLYGSAVGPGGPAAGQQTLAGNEQGFTQGLRTQQEQRAAQAQQQSQAQQYLQLLSTLRGPADWAKYQQVLGSTPGGMRDLTAAAMGQYVPGGGATTGMQPEAVSLQSMMGQVSGQGYNPQAAGQPLNMPNVYQQDSQGMYAQQPQQPYQNTYQPQAQPQQQQAQQAYQQTQPYAQTIQNMVTPPDQQQQLQAQQQNLQAQQQQYQNMQYGVQPQAGGAAQALQASTNPAYAQEMQRKQQAQQQQVQQQYGQTNQAQNATGNGTNMMGAPQQQQSGLPQNQMNLPAPNQIAAQSWNNLAPSQKDMLMGQYEAQGWHKPDVEALRQQALPKYAANAPTAGTWRLGQ